ncbi:MAG: polysaccharide biosynthesis C-terminal domain-containing protein, partial [Nitrososphaerales archaeon]
RYGLLTASRGALALVAALIFVQAGLGGIGAVFGAAVASLVSMIFFGAHCLANTRHNNSNLRRQMVAYGLPLTLTYLAIMVLDVSDRFMIAWWMGPSAVAGYAASYDLTQQTVGVALNVFFLASYPRITVAWEAGGVQAARQAMVPLSHAMLLVAPLVAGLFIGLADDITQLVLGSAVQPDAARVMPWVAFAIVIGCLKSYFLDIAFQLAKVTHMQLRITVMMAVLNVALNIVLIPKFGVVGAAMSTAAAFSSGAVLSWWFGRRLGIYSARKRDVMSMTLAFLAIVLSIQLVPTSAYSGLADVILRLLAGLAGYVVAVMVTNLAGVRLGLMDKLNATIRKGA